MYSEPHIQRTGSVSPPNFSHAMLNAQVLRSEQSLRQRKPALGALVALGAALLLFTGELMSGTDTAFALLVLLFALLTGLAVRTLGGLGTLMGLCVAYMACQHVLFSQVVKFALGQPAQSRLTVPCDTMGIYVLSMTGIWLAALLFKHLKIDRLQPLIPPVLAPRTLFFWAVITGVLGVARQILMLKSGVDAETGAANMGGILGPINQITFLIPLSVASGTAYEIVASRGRKSLGTINSLTMLFPLLLSMVSGSRSGIGIVITYIVTCMAFRFRFRFVHYACFALLGYFALFVLFPFALEARNVARTPRFEENVRIASSLFVEILLDPVKFQNKEAKQNANQMKSSLRSSLFYFGKPMSTPDRYAIISSTDAIVAATEQNGTTGMQTIKPGFLMLAPRFLVPDKPTKGTSNFLAHRAPGLVGKHDFITGITLGFIPDSFSSYGWWGSLVIPFLIAFFCFSTCSWVMHNALSNNIFATSVLFTYIWQFSENPIAAMIGFILQNSATVAVVLFSLRTIIRILESFFNKVKTVSSI